MGGEERRGASRARAAAGTAEEGKKCRSQEGTLRGDEGEMGEAAEGGQVEAVEFSILTGRNALLGCCAFLIWGNGRDDLLRGLRWKPDDNTITRLAPLMIEPTAIVLARGFLCSSSSAFLLRTPTLP